ncbi:MAG: alpha/beta hydrolase fold domain-containing protein [Trueperaceae bacterium]
MLSRVRWKKWLFLSFIIGLLVVGGFTAYVVGIEGRSIQSKLLELYLHARGKKHFTDPETFQAFVERQSQANRVSYTLPQDVGFRSSVSEDIFHGMQVFTLSPPQRSETFILYFHGGSYISQPFASHWQFLDDIAVSRGATIIVPLYPKTPYYQFRDAYERLHAFYDELNKTIDPQTMTFMGESAGGGLSLGFLLDLAVQGKPQPAQTILLSPWLDVTLNHPDVERLERLDPILGIYASREFGKMWAGNTATKDYRVSPLYGSLSDVTSELALFIGTYDLHLPEARSFRENVDQSGKTMHYYEYPYMVHGFFAHPIPEAAKAKRQILELLQR